MKTWYQAVWVDENGGFRVNGAISEDREECVGMCANHSAIKAGAKLHYIDEWDEWENSTYYAGL